MKIAFLHMTLGLTNRGSEKVIDQVAAALSKKQSVSVFQSGKVEQKPYSVIRVHGVDTAPPASPTNMLEKILFRLSLNHASRLVRTFTQACIPKIAKLKPDIIVAVNGGVQVKMLKRALPDSRIVVFGHAGIGHDDLSNLKAEPDLFVALTEQARAWADQHKRHTKVVHIPNPIDVATVTRAKAIDLTLPRPIILTVAALSSYKNVRTVIRAMRHLNASFVLIGDGEESELVGRELSSLSNEFRWIQEVDPVAVASYYRSVDAFCFVPDPQEAFGMVYLEAMAARLPIVASDDPVRRGIVGDQGFFADPHNEEDVVNKLVKAVQIDRVDYSRELSKYKISTVADEIEREMYELIQK